VRLVGYVKRKRVIIYMYVIFSLYWFFYT